MSKKSQKIEELVKGFEGRTLPAHYLAFFECFNRQLFYEAHDVLEEIWLVKRSEPEGNFYKGLIQLAGAFVHLQKERVQPAAALFKLSRRNLETYGSPHAGLDVCIVLQRIDDWLSELEGEDVKSNPLRSGPAPQLGVQGT
jgi:predicted metal-dependent hydrolase